MMMFLLRTALYGTAIFAVILIGSFLLAVTGIALDIALIWMTGAEAPPRLALVALIALGCGASIAWKETRR